MSPKDIITEIYSNDGIRNTSFLNEVIHDDVVLEWYSSEGLIVKNKAAIVNLAQELKNNFATFSIEIIHNITENNKVSISYNQFGSSIENPKDLILIGRFISIWEFENDKIIKGYQISRPA